MDYRDSIVKIDLDWSWTMLERGKFQDVWADDYSVHSYVASWAAPPNWLQILIHRLPAGRYWERFEEMDETDLTVWSHLSELGVRGVRETPCVAKNCLAFEAGQLGCVGFKYLTGSAGKRWYGDRGTDIVRGYFCSDGTFAADNTDRLLGAIVIRKNGFPDNRN